MPPIIGSPFPDKRGNEPQPPPQGDGVSESTIDACDAAEDPAGGNDDDAAEAAPIMPPPMLHDDDDDDDDMIADAKVDDDNGGGVAVDVDEDDGAGGRAAAVRRSSKEQGLISEASGAGEPWRVHGAAASEERRCDRPLESSSIMDGPGKEG